MKSAGLTIIEPLIVIVVIAIMAAVTAVVYNGIQQRAVASSVNTNAEAWKRLIMQYETLHGDMHTTESTELISSCLHNYTTTDQGIMPGYCYNWAANPSNPNLNQQSQPYNASALSNLVDEMGSSLPSGETLTVKFSQDAAQGWGTMVTQVINLTVHSSSSSTSDSMRGRRYMSYYLNGNATCGSFNKTYFPIDNITRCNTLWQKPS